MNMEHLRKYPKFIATSAYNRAFPRPRRMQVHLKDFLKKDMIRTHSAYRVDSKPQHKYTTVQQLRPGTAHTSAGPCSKLASHELILKN